jgi:hypothetical protein
MRVGGIALIALVVGIAIGLLLLGRSPASASFTTQTPQTYSNVEEWEIIRDPETGRTKGIRVIRNAKIS